MDVLQKRIRQVKMAEIIDKAIKEYYDSKRIDTLLDSFGVAVRPI